MWQDKAVIDIIDDVFAPYRPFAKWRWSGEAVSFMADALPRSYCCQYRESDLEFASRLLAEEGLSWRFEDADDGPCMVLFADSSQRDAMPEDVCSASDGGIRYHGARAVEQQDTVQALAAQRQLHASLATVLSYDYKAKRIVAAQSPTRIAGMPALEMFDVPGQYAYANSAQARRHADLHMQGLEAGGQLWRGRSTVRSLRAGTRLVVTGAPLQRLGDDTAFAILGVTSVGVNNLPPPAVHALAELFGPIPELLEECSHGAATEDFELVIAQANQSGYANCFDAGWEQPRVAWRLGR